MKRNIIFYFSDQQRADTCGCYGQELDITPNLDRLAREGVVFEQAFSPQPVCGPCRAIFQSGRYATDTGCFRNNKMLPKDIKTLANYIQEQGYQTAYIGKWHLASEGTLSGDMQIDHSTSPIPKEYRGGYNGFWRASDVLEFTSHGYDGYVFDENNEKVEFKGYRVDCLTDMAMEFFDTMDRSKPFFMTISHIEPHHQNDRKHYEGPKGSKERFKDFSLPKDLEALGGDAKEEYADYLGACESLDKNLGRLIQRLKKEGLYENTVIIYSSDHGCHFKTRNNDEHLMGCDDYKRSCHDSSLHVPLVIAGGDFALAKRVKELVSTESLSKTILAIAGLDVGDKMIGENLLEVAKGNTHGRSNEVYAQISESRIARCIRTENYTYSVYSPHFDGGQRPNADIYADDFLYDNKKDPHQMNNLIKEASYTAIKLELRKKLLAWIERVEGYTPKIVDSLE